jgi:uncharacterized membrane protein
MVFYAFDPYCRKCISASPGPLLLSERFREKSLNRHRTIGKIYILGILHGSITGIYLAFFATGGIISSLGFGTLAVLWLFTAFQAIRNIKMKRVNSHRKWMIRNYSLTICGNFEVLAAHIRYPIWKGKLCNELHNYFLVMCVPNLLFAEWYVKRLKTLPSAPNLVI